MSPYKEAEDAHLGQCVVANQEDLIAKGLKPLHSLCMNECFLLMYELIAERLLQLEHQPGSYILDNPRSASLFQFFNIRHVFMALFIYIENDAATRPCRFFAEKYVFLGDKYTRGLWTSDKFMR